MLTEKETFAAVVERAKSIVIENFDFDKAVKAMRAIKFGWMANYDNEGIGSIPADIEAESRLNSLIDSAISSALSLINTGKPWGVTCTASSGFVVFVFDSGIIQAHMSLVAADSYDYDELLPLYAQLDTARGGAPRPPDNFDGGRQRRVLMLDK